MVIASRYNIPYLLDVPGRGEFVVGEIYAIDDEKVGFEICQMSVTKFNHTALKLRHLDVLERAAIHVDQGVEQLNVFAAGELFAEELRLAHESLCEITGEFSSDDLLGEIFSSFCVGK